MASYPDLQLYIGGHWKNAPGFPVINPADESTLGTVPAAIQSDLDAALAAATEGFQVWSRTSPAKRTDVIMKAVALIRGFVDERNKLVVLTGRASMGRREPRCTHQRRETTLLGCTTPQNLCGAAGMP